MKPQQLQWKGALSNIWKWRIKLEKGDEIITCLSNFALWNKVDVGFAEFRMIGAVKADNLQFAISEGFGKPGFEQVKNAYHEEEKNKGKSFEVLNCQGTISWEENDYSKPKVHAHIMLAENDGKGSAFGGHLIRAEVSIVAEIIIDVLSQKPSYVNVENWNMNNPATFQ